MPLYMDVHANVQGVGLEDVVQAHLMDLQVQSKYNVHYISYWFNQDAGKLFCLVDAPNADAAVDVHREAHGVLADDIIEVQQSMVEGFLGPMRETTEPAKLPAAANEAAPLDPGFRIIFFTDMEGSTALTQRLGDEKADAVLQAHDHIIREALREYIGAEVKHTGDGIMASFVSPRKAVDCAIAVQQAFDAHNKEHTDFPIRVRIGLSAGEPVERQNDLFGAAVQLAARACSYAQPGQIMAPGVIRDLCIGKGFRFHDQGDVALKGFEDAVRLYEIAWSE